MKTTENLLIGLILLCGIAVKLFGVLDMPGASNFYFATVIGMTILPLFYAVQNKFSIYTIVLILLAIESLGEIFYVQHWQGQGIVTTVGLSGTVLFPIILLFTSLRQWTLEKNRYLLFIAIILLLQIALVMTWAERLDNYRSITFYVLFAVIATLKLNKVQVRNELSNILTYYLIGATLFLIRDIFRLVS